MNRFAIYFPLKICRRPYSFAAFSQGRKCLAGSRTLENLSRPYVDSTRIRLPEELVKVAKTKNTKQHAEPEARPNEASEATKTPKSKKNAKKKVKIPIMSRKQMEKLVGKNDETQQRDTVVLTVPKKMPKDFSNRNEFIENIVKSYKEFITENPQPERRAHVQLNSKDESLVANLKAYVDACCSANMVLRSLATVNFYVRPKQPDKPSPLFMDIDLYQPAMSFYAAKGQWSDLKGICSTLEKVKIPFTPKVYATIFECIARREDSEKSRQILQHYRAKAREANISLNDLVDKSVFLRDQRKFTMKAINMLEPDFVPRYTSPPITYTNPMLEHLNADVEPVEVNINSMPTPEEPHKVSKSKRGFTPSQLRQMKEDQLKIESAGVLKVRNISIQPQNVTAQVKDSRKIVDKLLSTWHKDICRSTEQEISLARSKMMFSRNTRVDIYPYLNLLPIEKYADILIETLLQLAEGSGSHTPTEMQLCKDIGIKVHKHYSIQQRYQNTIVEKTESIYDAYSENLCAGVSSDNPRQLWQRIAYHATSDGPHFDVDSVTWPWPVLCEFGRFLFNIMLQEVKIDANASSSSDQVYLVPVLYTVFRNRDLVSRQEIRVHPVLSNLYLASSPETLNFASNMVPMLCPPIPWISPTFGGYFITSSDLLRLPFRGGTQLDRLKERPPSDTYPALDALNQLGCIPWRVNTRILDLVIEIFNKGGSDKLNVPLTPEKVLERTGVKAKPKLYSGYETTSMTNRIHSSALRLQEQAALYSIWCDTLYKLSLANHFRDKVFWLPHNMDFRGRVYPIPPHMNHLSSDMSRSLLFFNEKQPLGPDGLRWLKLHCVNLTGLKKRESIKTRLEFAEQVLDDIIDSAHNPLTGRQWWLQSDEPWQTLACCMEIADAVASPDPAEFMSSFPIHQDGSCNGLQHYAALGRDAKGARSVNLSPCETPQDVYSSVAALVEEARQADAKKGLPIAAALDGLIKRKVVKQTVMTTVYGVTMFGARLQIEKQLKAIGALSPSDTKRAAAYLSSKTFSSLGEMFTSAREIQDWFTDCARYISGSLQMHVEWVTPLGLPIVQPYVVKPKNAQTNIQNMRSNVISDRYGKVYSMKEKNAFPPNFVHSLDSCHMMLTSVNCEKAGITFVSVHDCFWTHANSVPLMSKICREQFVLLHSQPILEDLSKSFMERYESHLPTTSHPQGHYFMKIPKKGEFDLNDVRDSVFFFS